MRLDVFLFESALASSRNEAKVLVTEGAVSVNGKIITKPAYDVDDTDDIVVDRSVKRFVSRGGEKLFGAIQAFKINPAGKRCIDIGASSGGFTDCLLQMGALSVIAVDSGHSQLVSSLRCDERVISIEEYNARYLEPEDLPYTPDFAVMDVSFISATLIMPALYNCLSPKAEYVLLVKPQFEVGKAAVGKGGIVKDSATRLAALQRVVAFAESIGFSHRGSIESPIKGGDGNVEFLAYFVKE